MKNKKVVALIVAFLFMFNCMAVTGVSEAQAADDMSFNELMTKVNNLLIKFANNSDQPDLQKAYENLKNAVQGKYNEETKEKWTIDDFIDTYERAIDTDYSSAGRKLIKNKLEKAEIDLTQPQLKNSLGLFKLLEIFPVDERVEIVNKMKTGDYNLLKSEKNLVKRIRTELPDLDDAINSLDSNLDLEMYTFVLLALQPKADKPFITDAVDGNITIVIPDKIGKLPNVRTTVNDAVGGLKIKGLEFTNLDDMTKKFVNVVNKKLNSEQKDTLKAILAAEKYGLYEEAVVAKPGVKVDTKEGKPVIFEDGTRIEGLPAGQITINLKNEDDVKSTQDVKIAGKIYEFKFSVKDIGNVTLKLPTDNTQASLAFYDNGEWVKQTQNAEIITINGQDYVQATVTHFSIYAPVVMPTPDSGGGSGGGSSSGGSSSGGGGGGGSSSGGSSSNDTDKDKDDTKDPVIPGITIQLTDIKGHWAEKDIAELINLGAIGGYADKTFKPENKITRAEFAKILVKAYKLDNKNGKVFADTTNHWAKNDIAAAQSHGIVNGYTATTFGPDDVITREQMAAMVVNAAGLQDSKGALTFTDKAKVSAWAVDVVSAASAEGIIGGYEDNSFKPQNNATRAEAASVIMRALAK